MPSLQSVVQINTSAEELSSYSFLNKNWETGSEKCVEREKGEMAFSLKQQIVDFVNRETMNGARITIEQFILNSITQRSFFQNGWDLFIRWVPFTSGGKL